LLLVFGIGFNFSQQSIVATIETLNINTIFSLGFWYAKGAHLSSKGVDWATIFFIFGMMIMVEGMARVGFFRWLCMQLAKTVKYKIIPIFIAFMVLSAVLSMFIDSITVILFLVAVTIELSILLKFNPISMILAEIFCANLGGSSTMCGDPPNIIIGSKLGYTFMDFLCNTGIIAFIALIFTLIYFYLVCKKEYSQKEKIIDTSKFPDPQTAITDKKGFIISCIVFATAIILLITHASTHLSVATIGLFIAVITLATNRKHFLEILKKVDYKTLLFFVGLFVVVGGLEQTGVLELIAQIIEKISFGNPYILIAIIIWVSAIASAFVDNIPFAATMIPVIQSLEATSGIPLATMAWALSIGTDIGGSATPIGASANVVGTSVSAKSGHPITWARYCKFSVPATVMVIVISTIYIWIVYF
jgi:Na+/H+ antiporter NhaD/arsenite permease-like protein